jgi:hypothetical protein
MEDGALISTADSGQGKAEKAPPGLTTEASLESDSRWQVIERIANSEAFQKSSRLPALLRYLARCTILGDRNGLTEQSIGKAVFHKGKDYEPTEDSSVRVYIRQLRIRLHEFYRESGQSEIMIVDVPKGGYSLSFTPSLPQTEAKTSSWSLPARSNIILLSIIILLTTLSMVLAIGWYRAAISQRRVDVPWPIDQFVGEKRQAKVVLADAGYILRMLGDKKIPLDQYIDRSFVQQVMPKDVSRNEEHLFHYLSMSRITSMADVYAVSALTQLAGSYAQSLSFRSGRDLNANDLNGGNLIFIGASTSNPWVQVFEDSLNFQIVEDIGSSNYILNRAPLAGEQTRYSNSAVTGTSGEDYATIALLANPKGDGKILLVQGVRMEGTKSAIYMLFNKELRSRLQEKITAANRGNIPASFEVLLHARSVSGEPVSIDCLSVRIIKP